VIDDSQQSLFFSAFFIQDSLASLAPMRSMGSRLRDARKGIIFRTARVGILAERLFFIAGLYPR